MKMIAGLFALEVFDEFEDLGLDGNVQGSGGLVGDEDFGLADEGHGDHHALPHAAGELMQVIVHAGPRLRMPTGGHLDRLRLRLHFETSLCAP